MPKWIESGDLVEGTIYPVNCRNFSIGIYVRSYEGLDYFKGIRTKFDFTYVTTEQGYAIDWPIRAIEVKWLAELFDDALLDNGD